MLLNHTQYVQFDILHKIIVLFQNIDDTVTKRFSVITMNRKMIKSINLYVIFEAMCLGKI